MIGKCQAHKIQIIRCFTRPLASQLKGNYEKVNFDSITAAYGYKSKYELFRGWLVFKLCSYSSLINYLPQVN